MTVNQSTWKKVIYRNLKAFEVHRIKHSSMKKRILEARLNLCLWHFTSRTCFFNICSTVCWSKATLASHMSSYDFKLTKIRFTKGFQQQLTGNSCQFCEKVGGCAAGLRSHMRVHVAYATGHARIQLAWAVCYNCCYNEIIRLKM